MAEQPATRPKLRQLTPAQAYQAAVSLHRQGRLDVAEQAYQSVLRLAPEHSAALRHLGSLKTQRGRYAEAVKLIEKSLVHDPNSAGARNDLGMALMGLRRVEDASAEFAKAVALMPDFAEAHNNLGDALFKLSRSEEAAAAFERALAINPKFADAHNNFGNALATMKLCAQAIAHYDHAAMLQPDLAEAHYNAGVILATMKRPEQAVPRYEKALSIQPNYADAHAGLGQALGALQRHEQALQQFEAALALTPDSPDAHNRVGNALVNLNRLEQAMSHYRKAIELRPAFVEAHNNFGNALMSLERYEEAAEHFRTALTGPPSSIAHISSRNALGSALLKLNRAEEALGYFEQALAAKGAVGQSAEVERATAPVRPLAAQEYSNMGNALVELNRPGEALFYFERALAIDPALPSAHHGLGHAYVALGRLDESRHAFERAVELAPASPHFLRSLVDAKTVTPGDPQLAALENLARFPGRLSREEQVELHFALGKAHADLRQHESSFRHLAEGSALKRQDVEYDEAVEIGKLERSAKMFTAGLIERLRSQGEPSSLPIFIVGMPRSGTTLVEQMLASHPKVFGAGELEHFGRVAGRICEPAGATVPYPEMMASLPGERLRAIGADYLALLHKTTKSKTGVERITDKLPANFRLVGLIHLALPQSRIVHVRRDAMDTCFSCFTKLFRGSQPFTYDLGELGRYYRAYERMMAHWRSVLPVDAMLDVQYEKLVADFEPQARRIVAYCGLEWDERCLDFHQTQRPVRTASAAQVRQPIYHSAIGRWRPYEPWLGPLLDALDSP
jgi:tetratricopeptide (TPR) repeat protein